MRRQSIYSPQKDSNHNFAPKGFSMVLRTSALLLALAAAAPAQAVSGQDFIDFAGTHCRALIAEGRADMGFAAGKAEASFSQQEMLEFNRRFAQKLVNDYNIDPAKGCTLDVLTVKPVKEASSKPARRERHAQPQALRQEAVVAGVLGSRGNDAPVSVAYRLERMGESPWIITNITLNGQRLADRYREEYEAYARKGGSQAVLGNL